MLAQSTWLQLVKGEAQMDHVPRWELQQALDLISGKRDRATKIPK